VRRGLAIVALGVVLAAAGCGYHLARRGTELPADVGTLAVPVFKNETYEPGVEDLVTDALVREFERHRWVRIVPAAEADAVLTGVLKDFVTVPIAFATKDYAVEFRARARCKVQVRSRAGKVLWEDKDVAVDAEYEATPDIFASETNKRRAIARLAADLAEEVHDRLFDGF
jgi:outer membrane lipopolysaccharide assembly protein LptE/RlpB